MKYAFHPEAKAEFLAAIDLYEDREPGLGSDFAIEVHSTIENILGSRKLGLFLMMKSVGARLSVFPMASSILKMEMSFSFSL